MGKYEIIQHHFKIKNYLFESVFIDMEDTLLLRNLINKYKDCAWDLYNFIIITKYFYQSFLNNSHSKISEQVYKKMNSDLERTYTDLRIFQLCIENEINEELSLIYNIKGKNFNFKVNLDRLMNRDVISILNINTSGILNRTKDEKLRSKIINMNLIYSVINRIIGLVRFNKKTSIVEDIVMPGIHPEFSELFKKIQFTKGYIIIFPNSYIENLIKLVYRRKIIRFEPIYIKYKIDEESQYNPTVLDSLKNENYTNPIWMKNLNISDFKSLKKSEIVDSILDHHFDANLLIYNINFLNSIKISPNHEFLKIIDNMSIQTNILDKEYVTKNRIEESLIDSSEGVIYLNSEKLSEIPQDKLNCLSFINILKIEYNRFPSFFMEYRRDGRVRLYNYNYPVNFQLSHLVRNTINIKNSNLSDKSIIKNFLNLKIWKTFDKEITNISLFFWQKISENLIIIISKKFKINYILKGELINKIETNLKLESILIILESLVPKQIIALEDRITWLVLNHLDNIINLDLSDINKVEKILNDLKINKKKMHVIKNIYTLQKTYTDKNYTEIFWVDASSNGIQLITFRLGKFNDLLLQLTNIIDNKTDCRNIYTYVTNEIKKIDHKNFIDIFLSNKISVEEFNTLYNDDDNKDRIMPGTYGKGLKRSRKDMNDYITVDNLHIWEKLDKKEKDCLSDYLWNLVFTILKNIGFDLGLYKKACQSFLGEEETLVCWYNDCDLPIIPFKEKKSNRNNLVKKLDMLKFNKEKYNKKDYQNKKKEINEKIAYHERTYSKRTKIRTNDTFISPRINHTNLQIDRIKTLTSLAPNATHSYDASNMDKTITILRKIGINALPIFDSLGGWLKYMSMVKVAFKLANIINIENNYAKHKYPYIEINLTKDERIKLYIKILESSYFIR